MLALSLLLLSLCGLPASARGIHTRDSALQYKRQTATCRSTYGADSEPCGGADSGFCFNPKEGQTCCATDSGFCDAGRYCAPVPGFCCLEGEDIETCAKKAGLEVPLSASNATATSASTSTSVSMSMSMSMATSTSSATLGASDITTVSGPTETVVPILKQSVAVTATATQVQNVTCAFATTTNPIMTPAAAEPTMLFASMAPTITTPATPAVQAVPTSKSNTNGTSTSHPLVAVSFAVKRTCTSAGLMKIIMAMAASIIFC
ncbi:hypothetical protein GGR52DRAFT_570651 [Hypoxylon sp. FL1284]|nr:hypothetical protein GGR52DRAFT_570651 [Hypoxylon sp. FL1284]